jgi:protein TonB
MRFLPALLGALLITVAVFLFMQSLIRSQQAQDMTLLVQTHVEVFRPEPEEKEPEPEEDVLEEPKDEPVMESLEVAPPKPEPANELEIAALDLAVGEISVKAVGDHWSAPMGTGVVTMAGGGGEDAHGYIEVIPFDTRKPNVPEVAWQNKISGWVLVAFNVTPQGGTRNVRVLDARPRGVFEEKVVAAVEDWRYTVNFHGRNSANVVLTQKVDVLWQNYPNNLPNVD